MRFEISNQFLKSKIMGRIILIVVLLFVMEVITVGYFLMLVKQIDTSAIVIILVVSVLIFFATVVGGILGIFILKSAWKNYFVQIDNQSILINGNLLIKQTSARIMLSDIFSLQENKDRTYLQTRTGIFSFYNNMDNYNVLKSHLLQIMQANRG